MVLLAIRDRKDRGFFKPLAFNNIFDGLRNLAVAAQDPNTILFKYPGDFEIFHIANFEGKTLTEGESPITLLPSPLFICDVASLDHPRTAEDIGGAN